ncbi:MAG TPA: histidine kinase [Clostridia bacterium]|nr:histidine kinase [Clostridia bacterium]
MLKHKSLLRRKFFNKVFFTYTLITVCAVLVIAYMAYQNLNNSLLKKERERNEYVLGSIHEYFGRKTAFAKNIVQNIYINSALQSEILYLMTKGYNMHLGYKLDNLLLSPSYKFSGFENYFNISMSRDSDITGICIYSNSQPEAYVYSNTGRTIYPRDSHVMNYLKIYQDNTRSITVLPAHKVNYLDSKTGPLVFTVIFPFKDLFSSGIPGYITIDFSVEGLKSEFIKFRSDYKGNLLVMTDIGEIVFDSSETLYNSKYPNFESLNRGNIHSDLFKRNLINKISSDDSNTITAAILPQARLFKNRSANLITIFSISLACIIAVLLMTIITMLTFSKRIESLMTGIKNINSGNLKSRINVKNNGDEISEIALSFNSMCDSVNDYIDRVYLSEIKQKNAELKALQAQINPHFLYNTLECIRMRALVKGAEDVSDMIFLLSSIFRNSIKGKPIVTVGNEIKYCKMYLDLFNMKTSNPITVEFDIKEGTEECGIMRDLIQPIVENYVIHGFDPDKYENILTIRVFKDESDLYIYVIDNGSGINCAKLNEIERSLKGLPAENSQGLGLSNVNDRIRLLFGELYGVDILSQEGIGTVVMLKLPLKTREELERYVQSIHS